MRINQMLRSVTNDKSIPNTCVKPYKINKPMEKYMEIIMNNEDKQMSVVHEIFSSENLSFVNKSVKNGNYYMLDKYNIVIRKNEFGNHKSVFGWIYDANHEPINMHIDPILITTASNDITTITLQHLMNRFPSAFKTARGALNKIYSSINIDLNIN